MTENPQTLPARPGLFGAVRRFLSRRAKVRPWLLALGVAGLGSMASASYCTATYATTGSSTTLGIYNLGSNTFKSVASVFPTGADPNAITQSRVDGRIYYIERNSNHLHYIDPNTLADTDVAILNPAPTGNIPNTTTKIVAVGGTSNPSGGFYVYLNNGQFGSVNLTNGNVTTTAGVSGYQTLTPPAGYTIAASTNGDIATINSTTYIIAQVPAPTSPATTPTAGSYIFQIDLSSGQLSNPVALKNNGTQWATTATANGLAIDPATGTFLLSTANGPGGTASPAPGMYSLDIASGNTTLKTGVSGLSDLGACGLAPDAPTLAKSFSPATVQGSPASTTLTITIGNTNQAPYYLNIDLTDTFPTGMTYGGGGATTCTDNTGAPITVNFNAGSVVVPAGSPIKAGGCTVTVPVSISGPGTYTNTVAGGSLQTTAGTASATATATVVVNYSAPTITKAFSPTSVALNGVSTITFTLTNGNGVPLNNLNFTDALSGMSVSNATIGGTCTGVTSSPALAVGATSLNLTVPTLAASSSCTVSVQVTGNTIGVNPNTTSGVTSTQTPTAGAASNTANLTVTPLTPTVSKAFNPVVSLVTPSTGGTTSVTITLTNPNNAAITSFNLKDDLAGSMAVTGLTIGSVTSDSCKGSGTETTTSGVFQLSGGTLPTTGCSIVLALNIPAGVSGDKINTITGTNVTGSVNGQTTPAPTNATATLTVYNLSIAKSVNKSSALAGDAVIYTVVVTNNGSNKIASLSFSDPTPSGATLGSWTCTPSSANSACAASGTGVISDSVSVNGGDTLTYSINATVNSSGTVGSTVTNTAKITPSSAGGANLTASATTTVVGSPNISLSKLVRNAGTAAAPVTNNAFGNSAQGAPGQLLEYCVSYANTGTGPANSFSLTDALSSNTQGALSGYGTGLGLYQVAGGTVASGNTSTPTGGVNLTSAADADAGTLTAGQMTLTISSLAAGANGVVCFKTTVQ